MKPFLWSTSVFIILFFLINKALAVCPICTVAACMGLGLSHYLGIDDIISGIWIGAVVLSSSLWIVDILKRKNIHFPYLKLLIVFSFYFFTILPLYRTGMIGIDGNTLWKMDKLVLGIVIGSISFLIGVFADLFLRALNDCKVFFYFQRLILPISCLVFTTTIFYLITR